MPTRTEPGRNELERLEALALEVSSGKAPAEALLGAVRPVVCRWALIRTGDGDVAEDVAQEVLMRVARAIDGFRGDSRFSTWLYRVVANAATDVERREAREHRARAGAREDGVRPGPVDAAAGRRIRELLDAVMSRLSANQRVAFDLVDLQGYSGVEAAAMLEMNQSTLRVHLARARTVVREAIAEGSASDG